MNTIFDEIIDNMNGLIQDKPVDSFVVYGCDLNHLDDLIKKGNVADVESRCNCFIQIFSYLSQFPQFLETYPKFASVVRRKCKEIGKHVDIAIVMKDLPSKKGEELIRLCQRLISMTDFLNVTSAPKGFIPPPKDIANMDFDNAIANRKKSHPGVGHQKQSTINATLATAVYQQPQPGISV